MSEGKVELHYTRTPDSGSQYEMFGTQRDVMAGACSMLIYTIRHQGGSYGMRLALLGEAIQTLVESVDALR